MHILLKGTTKCSNMAANILHGNPKPHPPPHPHPRGGVSRSNSTFSKHGHAAYQIKENQECNNMVANIISCRSPHPSDRVSRSKFIFFRTWSCCISNYRASRMQQHGRKYFASRLLMPLIHPSPNSGDGVNRPKFSFSEQGYVAYQIEENHKCNIMDANILPAYPPPPPTLGME